MHGECNTILEGIFPKEINTRPSKSKDYDSMNVGCNSPRAHIKQMAQPSDMNFSNQTVLGKVGVGDIFGFRVLRDSEYMRINEAANKPYEPPVRLSVVADSAQVTLLSFNNRDLDFIYPRLRKHILGELISRYDFDEMDILRIQEGGDQEWNGFKRKSVMNLLLKIAKQKKAASDELFA